MVEMRVKVFVLIVFTICCSSLVEAWPNAPHKSHPVGRELPPPIDADAKAKEFVQKSLETVMRIHEEYTQQKSDIMDIANDPEPDRLNRLLDSYMEAFKEISLKARSWNLAEVIDEETRQAIIELSTAGGVFNLGAEFVNLISNSNWLTALLLEENRTFYDNNEMTYPISENNMIETNQLWERWYTKLSDNAEQTFFKAIDIIRKKAPEHRISPVELWYVSYSTERMAQIEHVVNQLKPFYAQLHAYVRQQLQREFNDTGIKAGGRIPEHLYKYAQLSIWSNDVLTDDDFGSDTFTKYNRFFEQAKYTPEDMVKIASDYYQSLGFANVSAEFWESNIYEVSNDSTVLCPGAIYGQSPNITLAYCSQVDFEAYALHHMLFLNIPSSKLRESLPVYFDYDYDLEVAIGEAVKLAAISRTHLKGIGMTEEELTDQLMLFTNLRLAIITMFSLMSAYVELKVMTEYMSARIEKAKLNDYYWQLMSHRAGVEPPIERPADALDLPYAYYQDLNDNTDILDKFSYHILAHQIYLAACTQARHTGPLSDCDLYGNKDVGAIFQKMLAAGSSKPYEELLAMLLTDSQKLDGNALLEYFAPTRTFLNNKKLPTTGWLHSK